MTSYKKLNAWKKAMLLIKKVYTVTKEYSKEEIFALTSQTKRATVSIAANIAEGVGRNHKKDTIQFLHIARGIVQIISKEKYNTLENVIDEELKILNGLIRSFEVRTDLN